MAANHERELIVCATDFSAESASALAWALAFARREGAAVDVVHVLPEPTQDLQALATDAARFHAARVEQIRARLAEVTAPAGEQPVPITSTVLIGDPHVEITVHARNAKARMVVLGACGRSAIGRWVLGSVAERTVRTSICPVVVVPRAPTDHVWFPDRPLRAVVGFEGQGEGEDGRDLLALAAALRQHAPCDVTFLHLYWPPEEYARLGLGGARDLSKPDPDVVASLEPKLRARVGVLPGRGAVSLRIEPTWGEPAVGLLAGIEQAEADLLIVGAHQRHGLARVVAGSVAERLSRAIASCPVICVPLSGMTQEPGVVPGGLPRILTVLAPTDLSPASNAAVPHAYALLRATGGVVELVFVNEHVLPTPIFAYEDPYQLTAEQRRQIEDKLRALIPREAEALGITTHVTVIDGGKAEQAILQASERLGVDVISLGSRGRGELARAFLGSVAQEVVRHARRPVFVVRTRD